MFQRGFKHSKTIKVRPRAFISFLVFETPMKHLHSFLKYYFLNSLIIHLVKTKNITMVKEVGYPVLISIDVDDFTSLFTP